LLDLKDPQSKAESIYSPNGVSPGGNREGAARGPAFARCTTDSLLLRLAAGQEPPGVLGPPGLPRKSKIFTPPETKSVETLPPPAYPGNGGTAGPSWSRRSIAPSAGRGAYVSQHPFAGVSLGPRARPSWAPTVRDPYTKHTDQRMYRESTAGLERERQEIRSGFTRW
jgi:hypothetical protein